jgi:membrane protein
MTQPEFSARLHKAVETVRLYLAFIHKSFDKDNCWQASSALSFTTLFAVVPLMLVVFSVVSAIPAFSQWDTEVRAFISRNLIPASGAEVLGYIERFAEQAGHLTAAGVLILFATAVLLLRTIEQSINRIWEVEHPRRELVSFLLYWAIISLGPLLLVGGIAMSSFIGSHTGLDLNLLFLAPWLLTWLAFSLVYIFVPNCFVPWRAGVVGGHWWQPPCLRWRSWYLPGLWPISPPTR